MRGIKYSFSPDYKNIEIKRCSSSMHSTKAHMHNELSIAIVEKGNFVVELYGKNYFLNDRCLLIIPPKVVHMCKPVNQDNWNFRMLYIAEDWIEKIFNMESSEIKFMYKELDDIDYYKIIKAFSVIENFERNIGSESGLIEYISSILLFKQEEYKKITVSVQDLKALCSIKDFIETNYQENLILQDLVDVSGLSKYYIIRKFEQRFGTSPHQYLTSLRINHARKIIKRNKSISEVAVESGFYDQAHFTKAFKEYTGITPLKYINNIA